ncbi:MAG: hypothetical protein NTY01_21685 [Verrucomicrobia bacterium]|nr:hypothetical protein [Verrucomicrobiota bacterium]
MIDAETLSPIRGAEIMLGGNYLEERLGIQDDLSTPRAQQREFQVSARTASDGVAVFALSWQKEYPWSWNRPRDPDGHGGWTSARSWTRPVDDVEKIEGAVIRHPDYVGNTLMMAWDRKMVEFGQNKESEVQNTEVVDRFESFWQGMMSNPAARFCVLKLGENFPDYGKIQCRRPEFFERIRQKDYGVVFTEPANMTGLDRTPQSFAGPYMVVLLQCPLQRSRQVVETKRTDAMRNPPTERRLGSENETARERPRSEVSKKEPGQQQTVSEPNMQTVTSDLARKHKLFLGTTGVFLNRPMGGLPAGIVISEIQHRVIQSETDFYRKIGEHEKDGSVAVGIWVRNSEGRWERSQAVFIINK